jgi:HD superfamily phosphohydrolase
MLAMAMEKADKELGLTAFKTPEEYLAMDDYTVWAALKKCEASKGIIGDLEKRRMLKCAYERTFYEKDTMVSNIFGREAYRQQMQNEIAKEAGVKPESVVIDVPTVPSVPYHHAVLMESMEIPVFSRSQTGKKTPYRLSDVSQIIENLKGFINILRVYTNASDREKVEQATAKILGKIPTTAKISY